MPDEKCRDIARPLVGFAREAGELHVEDSEIFADADPYVEQYSVDSSYQTISLLNYSPLCVLSPSR